MIGSRLSDLCRESGMIVHYLTTSKSKIEKREDYKGFYWDPKSEEIEKECLDGVSTIIHLAGASIAEKWTSEYKETIIKSRTETAALLYDTLKNNEHQVENFISASAIGKYPDSLEKLYFEDDEVLADNFVGTVVKKWEAAADRFSNLGIDVAKIRV